MVPIVKEHVTQQGAQIVEEIPAGHQVLAQPPVLIIQQFQLGKEQKRQQVQSDQEIGQILLAMTEGVTQVE